MFSVIYINIEFLSRKLKPLIDFVKPPFLWVGHMLGNENGGNQQYEMGTSSSKTADTESRPGGSSEKAVATTGFGWFSSVGVRRRNRVSVSLA